MDPEGMSHEFGADDPDGRQYAPGINNHSDNRGAPSGPPSVAHSRQSSRRSNRSGGNYDGVNQQDEQSYYSRQSKQSSRGGGGSRSYYDGQEQGTIQEEGSYYSRDSRASSRNGSTIRSANGPESVYSQGDEPSYYSRDSRGSRDSYSKRSGYGDEDESRASSYKSSKKGRAAAAPTKEVDNNKRAMWWYNFSRCVTFPFPDRCIRKDDAEAKQAWREKVAICFCVFLASAFFVGIFGFVPVLLCRERTVYTLGNVQERTNEDWIVLHGFVYDVGGLFERHPTGPQGIEAFLHDDASRMFPRMPPALLPDMCLNKAKFEESEALQSKEPSCEDFTPEDLKNGLPCHTFVTGTNATAKYMGEFEKGVLAHDGAVLLESPFTFWVSIHDRVYNVTKYVNDIRNEQTKQIEKDHPNAYLEPTLNNLVINKLNEDATELFLSVYPDDRQLGCLDELFYVGIIDTRFDVVCFVLNILMYFLLVFVALIMIAQMICSLMYIAKGTRTYSEEDTQDQVIVMVPCYNEGGEELIKTIDSVMGTTYPEENKVIFIIADGVVTGAGQELSTPEHLAEILGFEMDPHNDELYGYESIGLLTENKARVYHGYYEVEDRSLKYLVVVKHGLPMEQQGSAKPGNRGKRDSQLIIMGYFNRIYHGRELSELDAAIEDALIDLNMQSDDMRLLMTIDADTRVDEMSVTHMTYAMNQNDRILALCGETKVDNKWQSWVTMMQVFEYYNNHHMKKGFESAFGCVTCLPGCFTMYRILNDDGKPLLADDHVYAEYLRNDIDSLHEQNLFHLGEDRMLTTLLLHFFPGMFLSYVPEAQCFTIVPHTLRILLSQRRRWINSTYHNLLELTKVKTMCGVCCCSMKTVVYLDLIACMILPASTVYAVYLIFLVAAGKTQFSLLLLVLYGMIIGVQIVVFIVRSRYDFLFWFTYFTIIGVPVFYFLLPLYAFWHMDDFSWGETRKVAAMQQSFNNPKPQPTEEDYDSTESDDESEGYSRRDSR
jgi:chitin synthase